MLNKNPYSLTFGKLPTELILRTNQESEVLDALLSDPSSQQVFMVTGIRGSGKTVFMTNIAKAISNLEEWVVIELNPERDLLVSLAAKLSSEEWLANLFHLSKINLSFWGFGIEVDGTPPITDIETALTKMLSSMKKQGKKLLISIDEVTNSPEMRAFASAFQIFLRQDLPVYLLMTGLYSNIDALQNEDTMTFLHRAPKVELKPLNIGAVADNYEKVLRLDRQTAVRMAQSTKGYSFAFQVLGYLAWELNGNDKKIQAAYRQYLEEYVYEKVWSELPEGERKVLYAIACTESGKNKDIREVLQVDSNHLNPYRKKLIRRGIVSGVTYGHLTFTLPAFGEFVKENYIPR